MTLALALLIATAPAAPPSVVDNGFGGAEALVALPSVDFSQAIPANGATLPLNGRLVAFGQFFGVDDPRARAVLFERIDVLTGERTQLRSEEKQGAGRGATAYVVDVGELAVGETVTIGCSLCFDTWSATVIDAVDERAPAFNVGSKSRIGVIDLGGERDDDGDLANDVGGYQVRACIPAPIDAAGGAVALRTITDVNDGLTTATQGGACALDEVDVAVFADGEPRRFCFTTLAVDASGNESLFHEDICADLPPHVEGGCTQAGASTSSLAFVALLLALRARGRARA